MLKRSEIVALSKAAIQRVAAGKTGVIPANKKHTERLAQLKQEKKAHENAKAPGDRKRA
jgi:hypothetical protein